MGSAVLIEFGDLAGDAMSYQWNFRTGEAFGPFSENDYSFVVIDPHGGAAPVPELLADVEKAQTSGWQDTGLYKWQTEWSEDSRMLNGVDPYTLGLGSMHVTNDDYLSDLFVRNVYFAGHPRGFIFDRIFDHVEDFLHIRPDERVSTVGPQLLAPVLDETSTYFDEASQITDPRYFYQSVGSIYQIPR